MSELWKKFLTISIWLAIGLFVIRGLLSYDELVYGINYGDIIGTLYMIFGFAGESIGATTILMTVFNKWAWRCKIINYLTCRIPVLSNQYEGYLISDYDNIKRKAYLEIEQTFLKINIKLKTDESSSNTIISSIETINNEYQLVYIYLNEPQAHIQDRSAMHYGTVVMKIDNPSKLYGNYYTGRNTKGSLVFESVNE